MRSYKEYIFSIFLPVVFLNLSVAYADKGKAVWVHEGKYSWQLKGPERHVRLYQNATNAELEILSGQPDITSLGIWGILHGAAGPFITDDGLRHIGKMKKLKELGLSGLNITDDGLQYISGLRKLQKLNLCMTKITDKGLAHLSGLENLQELWLDFLPLTDAGVVHLKNMTRLKVLRFFWRNNYR